MKLLVLIGTDYHLNQLPHFLTHYAGIGVDKFVCGLHGQHVDEARALLAPYSFEIVADYGTEPYDQVANSHWVTHFNDFRRGYVQPGEWCLFADVDEFHEYPVDFFAHLDPHINAIRGKWVERLATSDGQLLPCFPTGNIGQQFPFATHEIFCGISQKVMAVRADLELIDGYHWIKGGTATPVYYPEGLNVHHFRWDDRAAAKYQGINWTKHYKLSSGYVPALQGVFYMNPPFPAVGCSDGQHTLAPKISVILPVQNAAAQIGAAIKSIQTQTFSAWELIIIDNGSTDHTQAVIAPYAQGDRRIHMVAQAQDSLSSARRRGLELAQGGYIYCLTAGYVSLPDTLQRLYEALETQPTAVAAYGAMVGMQRSANPLDILAQLVDDHFLDRGAVAIRRSALAEALTLTDSDLKDQELWWLLAAAGSITYLAGDPLSTPDSARSMHLVSPTNDAHAIGESAPIKLAYLIIAHRQPNHLARLIHALDDENSYFYIHIDGKVPQEPFQAVVPQRANINFLQNRVEVQWGQLSVVQAILNLIDDANASGHVFKYYTVLSGSDYPIKHKREIYARLQASNCQFLRIDRKLTNKRNNSHRHFLKNLPQGTYFANLTPYHGSMYWSLTAACVQYILDFVHDNPSYLEIHRHIFAPDEVFFHTLVKHSPFADAITHDFSDGIHPDNTHHGNHFIDWRTNRVCLTLNESDFEDLRASTALFARKFDEQKSSKLLDLLDRYIHFSQARESVNQTLPEGC